MACPSCCASCPSRFWLSRSPRVLAIWWRRASGWVKCWNRAHEIGERLVEGRHVGVAVVLEEAVQAVEQGVRRLVRDHVLRQAGEDQPPRQVLARVGEAGREVAEEQRLLLRAVVGVGLAKGVGIDPQPIDRPDDGLAGLGVAADLAVSVAHEEGRRQRLAAQRPFEVPDRGHRHRVDHLLVELRVAFGRGQPVLRQQVRPVQVHRRVEAPARRVVVDDLEVLADRPRLEILPGHAEHRLVDQRRVELRGQARVERVGPQTPVRRRRMHGATRCG